MTIPSRRQTDIALLQHLLDRAMRPGDPVTLDAWTCAAERVFDAAARAEPAAATDPSPPET